MIFISHPQTLLHSLSCPLLPPLRTPSLLSFLLNALPPSSPSSSSSSSLHSFPPLLPLLCTPSLLFFLLSALPPTSPSSSPHSLPPSSPSSFLHSLPVSSLPPSLSLCQSLWRPSHFTLTVRGSLSSMTSELVWCSCHWQCTGSCSLGSTVR